MNIITALPLAILRAQYTIVRYPLRLVDEQVIAHLAPAAPARRLYRGSLSLLDCAVGTVLGHQDRAHDAADTAPRVTLVSGTASDTDHDPSAPDTAAADAETAPRSATVENAELNEKAAHQLDTDLLAEHLEDIETQYQLEHPPTTGTAEPTTDTVITQLEDAASTEPDTTLSGELADRVAELARAETPPPGTRTTPTGKRH
ncbi:hypothetical protein ACVH9Z_27470 [Rhodococcus opacus]|uniref:Uncharacterized protein n=1 Tax=Rhodococcus opacus TaxID=37919 RepID=A0AAX3Y4Q6_RHOOP|nr:MULTISPECIES: hypothetical protein [Rhodococcus]MCZ4586937.1 hypothetical protein [Rhodococcus opacus]MDV6244741.1 hypothetical protein [Rhodococcus opacus]QDQ92891.1 hypothetical protein FND50_20345 [Rhodococcus sp. WB9]UNN01398.1 hypothetical protein MOO23_02375 [Rhodococcus opacus]WLF44262.1 hypothetical protein Q5707_19955 [Rhodococcus opacus]